MNKNSKFCFICFELKTLDNFHKHSMAIHGVRNECKDCRNSKKKITKNSSQRMCTNCFKVKPNTDEFFKFQKLKNDQNSRRLKATCLECQADYFFAYHLKKKYNLTREQYDKMVLEQKGICAICNNFSEKLKIDHNHNTSKIRKLLCNNCNAGIGLFYENFQIMESAISYLDFYGHCHSNMEDKYNRGKQMDVGVDNIFKLKGEYRPISIDEGFELVKDRGPKDHHPKEEDL